MRFILLVPFVFASQFFRRNEPGLLDGLLGDNDNGPLGGLLGGGHRNRGLLGDGGLLGTGIGGSRGLLGTGLLGNDGLGSRHHRHHNYYYGNDYNGHSAYYRKPSKHTYNKHDDYSKSVYYNKPSAHYNKKHTANYKKSSNKRTQKPATEATKKAIVIAKPKMDSTNKVSNENAKRPTDDHTMKKPAQYP